MAHGGFPLKGLISRVRGRVADPRKARRPLAVVMSMAVSSLVLSACIIPGLGGSGSGPSISSITPRIGPLSGGNQVTITGSNLANATSVSFGGHVTTDVEVVSSTKIIVPHVPAGSSATPVKVTVTTPAGTSGSTCLTLDLFCGQAYYYAVAHPFSVTLPVNLTGISVPIYKVLGISVNATGGDLTFSGSMSTSSGYYTHLPVAMEASASVAVQHVTVTVNGTVSHTFAIPLPLGLPYGLDLYVRVVPSLTVPIPLVTTVNDTFGFDASDADGVPSVGNFSNECTGPALGGSAGSMAGCFNVSLQPQMLAGTHADVVFNPLWLQVGPPELNVGVGPAIGVSAGAGTDSGLAPYWDVCAGAQWAAHLLITGRGGNLLGPFQITGSSTGDPAAHCALGPATSL